jgi:hypothetical protein
LGYRPTSLSLKEASDWVILRVFDRGSLVEVLQVRDFYGREFVQEFLTTYPGILPSHRILLAKALFQLSFRDFKCLEKSPFPTPVLKS